MTDLREQCREALWPGNPPGAPNRQTQDAMLDRLMAEMDTTEQQTIEKCKGVVTHAEEGESDFNHGYVIAGCNMMNLYDDEMIAQDTFDQLGITAKQIQAMGLTEYDLSALRRFLPEADHKFLHEALNSTGEAS